MRATIAWSYDRLEPQDRALFRRLAVFVGGAELEGCGAVCTLSAGLGIPAAASDDQMDQNAVLEGIASLVDNSLLMPVWSPNNPARWTMLETIREYRLECLEASGEALLARRRHADYFLAVAEQAELALIGPDQNRWLDQLDREHDNLQAVFSRLTSGTCAPTEGDPTLALRLAGVLWRFWYIRGPVTEGREWWEAALHAAPAGTHPAHRAKGHYGAGILALLQGDYVRAVSQAELGNKEGVAAGIEGLRHDMEGRRPAPRRYSLRSRGCPARAYRHPHSA